MNKYCKSLICIALVMSFLCASAYTDFEDNISAECAILYCADTDEVLYRKNADKKMLIASVTKIMTAIVAIENGELDMQISLKPEWCAVEGSSMYLDYTKQYTLRELLTGMMLVSGNDAATAIACYMRGDERSFAAMMNEKAAELNMTNSSFRNPHGLDDDEHYSTARDLAILTDYCMDNEDFREIVSSYSATIGKNTYYNHNKLLVNYEGCIGVKTGYTLAAGRTLVSCAERNGMRLICVTLNAPDDWSDHTKLLDHGFENYRLTAFTKQNFKLSLPVISAASPYTEAAVKNDLLLLSDKNSRVDVKLEVPQILFAGGVKGEKVGDIKLYVDGKLAAKENLVYTESVPTDNSVYLTFTQRLRRLFDEASKPIYIE